MEVNDSGKKPREFYIAMNVYGVPHYTFRKLEDMPTIYRNDAFLVREVLADPTPCANCERLEDQLYHESRKAPEVEYKLGHEIEVLKKQLEMCKEALDKILGKNEYCINKQPHKFIADECLAKLENEQVVSSGDRTIDCDRLLQCGEYAENET